MAGFAPVMVPRASLTTLRPAFGQPARMPR